MILHKINGGGGGNRKGVRLTASRVPGAVQTDYKHGAIFPLAHSGESGVILQPRGDKMKNVFGKIKLDCSACKSEGTMGATKVRRFGPVVVLIGYLIVIPSLLGVAAGAIMFFQSMGSSMANAGAHAGADLGAAMGVGMGFVIAAVSLVAGLIGWLLIGKKKVYKCARCGYIINRD